MLAIDQAGAGDVDDVVTFIRKKAEFDRAIGAFAGELRVTAAGIRRGLVGPPAVAGALLARDHGVAIGFAFYHFRYSSFAAQPSLWLDDLYVDSDRRRSGAGARLMHRLAEIIARLDGSHLGWTADVRNPAGMGFYRKLGATLIFQHEHSVTWRIDPASLLAATTGASS
jgi:GNAT superfamily N-acetyltransferase